jgi:hypothetical protein
LGRFYNVNATHFQDPLAILLAQIITIILVAEVLVGFQKNWSALSNWGDNRWYCTWASLLGLYSGILSFISCGILGKFEIFESDGLILLCFVYGTRFKSFKNKANEAV